jgi:hypothetical protein
MSSSPPELRVARCRSCPAPVHWVTLTGSGKRTPVDVERQAEPARNLVAVNHATGRGRTLRDADLADARQWAARGVTFHTNHYATCPDREAWRTGRFSRGRAVVT